MTYLQLFNAPLLIKTMILPTYLLTPWSKVLLEKLTGFQLLKKFSTFYGTRKFINTFTSAPSCPSQDNDISLCNVINPLSALEHSKSLSRTTFTNSMLLKTLRGIQEPLDVTTTEYTRKSEDYH